MTAYLKSFIGPRPPPIVFPPPSWEIDDESCKVAPSLRQQSELPEEPPISFAKRIGALIDSLPALPSAITSLTISTSPSQPDEGKQGFPVPPDMDKDLVRMLSSRHSIWNILASLKSNTGPKDSETPPPSAVEEEHGGLMIYAPLKPTNDSQLEIADTLTVHVDDPASTSINHPEPDEKIEGSTSASIPTNTTPSTAQTGKEKHIWVPSTTQLSLLATWWGYRLYLPPPVMAQLNGTSLKATARAAMLTTALKWLLDKIPLMLIPVQFRPAVKMLKKLSPVVGYVGVFIAWSWDRVRSLDKGNGVVLTATWLLPVALLPMSWDAGDIYGPRLASQDMSPSDDTEKKATKSNDSDKGKQKKTTKSSIFPW